MVVPVMEGTLHILQRENLRLKAELQREKAESDREKRELEKRLELQEEKISWLQSKLFGRSSEKLSAEEERQLRLFDEAEVAVGEQESTVQVKVHARRRAKRRPLPRELPREEVVIEIPEEQKRCACGAELVRIGEETSERLDIIPAKLRVIRTIRPKYACHACEGSGDEDRPAVRIAKKPPELIEKGIASAGLLAYIVTGKFCDSLPLYRQEKQFRRIGVDLSRKTMAQWMITAAKACEPVMDVLRDRVRAGPVLQVDETRVQVMREEGRENTSRSYMWVSRGGLSETPAVVYRYSPSRSQKVAEEMLEGYRGYLQTDGYQAYDRACSGRDGVVHVGCWAHARRGFTDAQKVSGQSGGAEKALEMIRQLYRIEGKREEQPLPQRFAEWRREQVEPVLKKLKAWLEDKALQVPPRTALGKAVSYTLGQWPKLVRYLDHADLTPDTNACERAIRPFVLGRKNWLMSGSPRGADASATLYSLIETAKANGREPYAYLRILFEELPTAKTIDDYTRLAP